ncbi:MAG: SH3 domain-containing protein [Chloroflexi bacterium]|nr:SH3 domain-containing protein [Chloroflexota bacterium]
MKARIAGSLLIAMFCVACSPTRMTRRGLADAPPATAHVIYVTPTAEPTLVPTAARLLPISTPTVNDQLERLADASAGCPPELGKLYSEASDQCLAGPDGHFCTGGLPPIVEPPVDDLRAPGALIEAARVDSLEIPATADGPGIGLVWLRLEETLSIDALLIGSVRIQHRASSESGGARWRSLTVESGIMPADCSAAPGNGVLVLQSLYGQTARLHINGVAAQINGTLIVLTQNHATKFIAFEGQIVLTAFGQSAALNVGQQLALRYKPGDWTRPAGPPGIPGLLEYELIEDLPILLFERPVPIPQPGFAQTQGGVNMRVSPDINSRLLYQVPAGETMSVLGISRDSQWLHIRLGNGETGWMSAELLARRLGEIRKVYDETPEPPQRLGIHARSASVNVAAGGNLREAPDTAFRIKRTLPYGTPLHLLARSPYSPWVKVSVDGLSGWMALFTLATKSVIGSLPIDYRVPLPPRPTPTPSFSYGGGHAYPDPAGGY